MVVIKKENIANRRIQVHDLETKTSKTISIRSTFNKDKIAQIIEEALVKEKV